METSQEERATHGNAAADQDAEDYRRLDVKEK